MPTLFADDQDALRWSRFRELAPEPMFETVRDQALGGCCLSFDDQAWLCTHCQLEIFRAKQGSSGVG